MEESASLTPAEMEEGGGWGFAIPVRGGGYVSMQGRYSQNRLRQENTEVVLSGPPFERSM